MNRLHLSTLLLSLLMGCGLPDELAHTTSTLSQSPVQVAGGYSGVCVRRSCQHQFSDIDIVVDNLAYEKAVVVHLRKPSGDWVDVPAQYVRTLKDGRELWHARDQNDGVVTCLPDVAFAVRSTVGGRTFWDNNHGVDYHLLGCGKMLTDAFPIQLNYSPWKSPTGTSGVGSLWVKNLAYEKAVSAVYSADGWASTKSVAATFSEPANLNGIETWSFQFPDDAWAAGAIEFAVAYDAHLGTGWGPFWDVTNGANYQTSLSP
jgi:Carbohydrate/starch-binding module (family 21)